MDIEWKTLRAELPEPVQTRLDAKRNARHAEKPEKDEKSLARTSDPPLAFAPGFLP